MWPLGVRCASQEVEEAAGDLCVKGSLGKAEGELRPTSLWDGGEVEWAQFQFLADRHREIRQVKEPVEATVVFTHGPWDTRGACPCKGLDLTQGGIRT